MSYGPWATELGAQLIGRIFKKLLKLDAWRLVLGAWRLQLLRTGLCSRHEDLPACSLALGPWSGSRGPRPTLHGARLLV